MLAIASWRLLDDCCCFLDWYGWLLTRGNRLCLDPALGRRLLQQFHIQDASKTSLVSLASDGGTYGPKVYHKPKNFKGGDHQAAASRSTFVGTRSVSKEGSI